MCFFQWNNILSSVTTSMVFPSNLTPDQEGVTEEARESRALTFISALYEVCKKIIKNFLIPLTFIFLPCVAFLF